MLQSILQKEVKSVGNHFTESAGESVRNAVTD